MKKYRVSGSSDYELTFEVISSQDDAPTPISHEESKRPIEPEAKPGEVFEIRGFVVVCAQEPAKRRAKQSTSTPLKIMGFLSIVIAFLTAIVNLVESYPW